MKKNALVLIVSLIFGIAASTACSPDKSGGNGSDNGASTEISLVGEWKDANLTAQDELNDKAFKDLTGKPYSDELFDELTDEQREKFFAAVGTAPDGWRITFNEDNTFEGGYLSDGFDGKYSYDLPTKTYTLVLNSPFGSWDSETGYADDAVKTATIKSVGETKIKLHFGSDDVELVKAK
ncbi:MAG: DUF4923 family protein [Acidobacteriota bacterium]|jgi:hypothetical protein|nr:DUF4923 family protein [Acidobacteriota bacterium]